MTPTLIMTKKIGCMVIISIDCAEKKDNKSGGDLAEASIAVIMGHFS